MRILIFGAAGFIGTHLVRHASERGHEVFALSRSGNTAGFDGISLKWAFGEPLPVVVSENISCAIHLAHDFNGDEGARLTQNETLTCIARLREAGVGRQIFFSSYSAGEHANSLYGRTKLAIEQGLAGAADVIIVRPGLVMGDGGIYGRIQRWARRLPVVPLPDGGAGMVPVITVERLCRETLALVEMTEPGHEANLFENKQRSLRQLVLEAAAEAGRHPRILPVPTSLFLFGLGIVEAIHIPLPFNADNLSGFLANQAAEHISTLQD